MLIEARAAEDDISHIGSNIALLTECETFLSFGSYKHCTPTGWPFEAKLLLFVTQRH